MLDHMRASDVVTVTRLDRLARPTRDLPDIAGQLQGVWRGPAQSGRALGRHHYAGRGHMVLTVFAGIAEFERSLIIDRIRTGRQAAQKRGVRFGRREDTVKLPRVQVRLRRRFRHAWKSTVLFTAQRVTGHDVFELFD